MTYLTWCLFNANSNSFKFCSIGGIAIRSIALDAELVASRKALCWCHACPIAVFFVLHFVEAVELADDLVHRTAFHHYSGSIRRVICRYLRRAEGESGPYCG